MLFYFQTVCLKAEKRIKVPGKVDCQKRRAPSPFQNPVSTPLSYIKPTLCRAALGVLRFPGFHKYLFFQCTHGDMCACVCVCTFQY